MEQRNERHGTLPDGFVQLLVNEVVSEVYVGGIFFGVAVINTLYVRPIDGSKAHRARLAGGVDDTIREVEGAKLEEQVAVAHAVTQSMEVSKQKAGLFIREFDDGIMVQRDATTDAVVV